MVKTIEYNEETIQITVDLNVDHSDISGVLHVVKLMIPTLSDRVYGHRATPTDSILRTVETLIDKGKEIIHNSKFEIDIEAILIKNGFKK